MNETKIEIITGTVKKDGPMKGKEWKALKITVGDWTKVIFPDSTFEMNYIESILNAE